MPKTEKAPVSIYSKFKRVDWGVLSEQTLENRQLTIDLLLAEIPEMGSLLEESKTLKNTKVSEFVNRAIDIITENSKSEAAKSLKVKSNIGALFFPPIDCEDKYFRKIITALLKSSYENRFLSIAPPIHPEVYNVLLKLYPSQVFLSSMADVDKSVWYRYIRRAVFPNTDTWGLFLLGLDLHPIYKLKVRPDIKEFSKSKFAKTLELFSNVSFESSTLGDIEHDLMPIKLSDEDVYVYNKNSNELLPKSSLIKEKLTSLQLDLDNILKQVPLSKSKSVITTSEYRKLTDLITEFVKTNKTKLDSIKEYSKFDWDKALLHCILELDVSENVINTLKDHISHSKVAKRLFIDTPNNPNIYTAIRYAMFGEDRTKAMSFADLTGIDYGLWVRLGGGTRNISNAAWTSLLFALNLHPYYQLELKTHEEIFDSASGLFYRTFHKYVLLHNKDSRAVTPKAYKALK